MVKPYVTIYTLKMLNYYLNSIMTYGFYSGKLPRQYTAFKVTIEVFRIMMGFRSNVRYIKLFLTWKT
jgi:hypothetical protein